MQKWITQLFAISEYAPIIENSLIFIELIRFEPI